MKAVAKERARTYTTRRGFSRTMTPLKTANFETILGKYALQAMGSRPALTGPVSVTLTFWFKRPAKPKYVIPTIGDIDNFQKSVLDALNGICWIDDKFIYRITAGKYFNLERDDDRIEIRIEEGFKE